MSRVDPSLSDDFPASGGRLTVASRLGVPAGAASRTEFAAAESVRGVDVGASDGLLLVAKRSRVRCFRK
jgi:hypothetical protein